MWPEIERARDENRRELVLTGPEISKRISENGLDSKIFSLIDLNYLSFTETCLTEVPDDVSKLINLQTLILHSNRIEKCSKKLTQLPKLKILDISTNFLEKLPEDLTNLAEIVTLNFSNNKLECFPILKTSSKLSVLDLSLNNLACFPDVCYEQLANLSEIKLHGNKIENIPNTIYILPSLKILDISGNQVKVLPGELADCHRLKELNLKSNPITDRRLFKLIEQCRTKQIIDYVKQHCSKTTPVQVTGANKSKKGKVKQKSESENEEDNNSSCKYCITVKPANNDFKIVIHNNVKSIREHIVCCILCNVSFSEELFKKFIQLQNKLHDSICEKRNSATIATHDFKKLGSGPLLYTSFPPRDFKIKPLNKTTEMTGAELFARLQTEANNLRKEKKRSTYSGVHKYLYLIEGKPAYPCLMNNQEEVISFPPITNSEISKIEMSTTEILIEVTSNVSQFVCKNVLSELLKDTAVLFDKNLEVCQVRILDQDGKLKVVFPSKVDLNFGKDSNVKCQFENVG